MKAGEIIEAMKEWALEELIDSWDNTGFQIGDINTQVDKVLVALDLDKNILNRAINGGCQMVITHHPLIFRPLNSINSTSYTGRLIMDIIKNNIVVYNAHSNLDLADNGVNDELARIIGLFNTEILHQLEIDKPLDKSFGYGRIGSVRQMPLKEFIQHVKNVLKLPSLMVYGNLDRIVTRVAVCGGSGSDFIYDAYRLGADLYITGDIKYHDAQLGHGLGLTIIDAGHYNTEKVILPVIKDYLNQYFKKSLNIDLVMESSLPQINY